MKFNSKQQDTGAHKKSRLAELQGLKQGIRTNDRIRRQAKENYSATINPFMGLHIDEASSTVHRMHLSGGTTSVNDRHRDERSTGLGICLLLVRRQLDVVNSPSSVIRLPVPGIRNDKCESYVRPISDHELSTTR